MIRDIKVRYYKKLYIEQSSINGLGLFAGEDIKTNDIILMFGGILALQTERYSGNYLKSTFVGISEDIMLCEMESSEKNYSDYINHSCEPNTGMYDAMTLIAICDIKKDEEILCDYAFWEANENWVLKLPCTCGSPICRHFITGTDWKKVKSTDRYFKYYSPFLKRRIIENEK